MTTAIDTPGTATRSLSPRDARGRFVARAGVPSQPPSVRSTRGARVLPARDVRGRFVAYPTTSAPSWYVLCVEGDRVRPDADPMPVAPPAAPLPQPLPPATVVRPPRSPRSRMRRDETLTWLSLALFLAVMAWYALSLPTPHH